MICLRTSLNNLRQVWLASQKVPAVVKQEEPKNVNVESDNLMKDNLFVLSVILFSLTLSIFWEPFRPVILTCIATHYVQPVTVVRSKFDLYAISPR